MYGVAQLINQPQIFTDVGLRYSRTDGSSTGCKPGNIVEVSSNGQTCVLRILEGSGNVTLQNVLSKHTEGCRLGRLCFAINIEPQAIILVFANVKDFENFEQVFKVATGNGKTSTKSVFDDRTEEASAVQYFQFYGYLSQQQNMMQDYIRTSTYQRAILQNMNDFRDKVVLDVGAGTGILSFFAIQAGARKVYAVEASSMASHAERLAEANNTSGILEVITGKIEEIDIPEQIDVLISEPMGYMLFNERMLETYLHAKKWLKPNGKMFPTRGDLYVAPFTDDALYMEHYGKSSFWCQTSFYGVDLNCLRQAAVQEYFKQPIVDTFDVRILMAKPCCHGVNFLTTKEEDLHKIHIPLQYTMLMTGTLHGLAFWFDVGFLGSTSPVWLSTAPQEPLTHWYQVRCLFPNPVFVRAGQRVSGNVTLHANQRQSYDVDMDISVDGTGVRSSNVLDLKNPFFRYTGGQTQPPPGTHNASPTESYWNNSNVVLNGGSVLSSGTLVSGQGLAAGNYQIGGGVFAYTSQATGNVMAVGTVSHTSPTGSSFITADEYNYRHVQYAGNNGEEYAESNYVGAMDTSGGYGLEVTQKS